MRKTAIAMALALAACAPPDTGKQKGAPTPAAPADIHASQNLTLDCRGATLGPDLTGAQLIERYGADNVTLDATIPGPEGETALVTLLYPDDPSRRAELSWRNPQAHTGLTDVKVAADAVAWTGPRGITVASSVEDVERANSASFTLYGFGWDYGGTVSDWKGGAFSLGEPGCAIRVVFDARENNESALGDREFSSDSPAIRAAQAHITSMGVQYRDTGPAP